MTEFQRKAFAMDVSPFWVYLAEFLASRYGLQGSDLEEPARWFLLHLARQAGSGHLRSDLEGIVGDMRAWYESRDEPGIPELVGSRLDEILGRGLESGLLGRLDNDASKADGLPVPRPPLLLTADRRHAYFLRRRREEDRFLEYMAERSSVAGNRYGPGRLGDSSPAAGEGSPASALASMIAAGGRLMLLSGGPGTGKTSAVASLLEAISEMHRRLALPRFRAALAAPTGRAAARLAESVPDCEGRTIHSLLGLVPGRPPKHCADKPLSDHLVVADEASMVDLPLMNALLDAVPLETPIVLVGDPDQLPSVEAGSILGDLLAGSLEARDAGRTGPLAGSSVRLTKVYRSNSSVLDAASAVREGNLEALDQCLEKASSPRRGLGNPDETARLIADRHNEARRRGESFIALGPLRRGEWGVAELNRRISRIIGGTSDPFAEMPIVVSQNDSSRSLWNGDRGEIEEIDGHLRAVFTIAGSRREFPLAVLPEWEPAWIQTIHKSQGSEFDSVTVILPPGAERLLSREILYTAITRARTRVELRSDTAMLAAALGRRVLRNSRIRRWAAGGRGG